MDEKIYTVYYNAVATDNGRHLIAVGWCNQAGWTPILRRVGETDDFRFTIENGGDIHTPVITPFGITAEIPGDPRSINIEDAYGKYQVQVNGLEPGESGDNTPGKWIESGKGGE